MPEEIIEPVEEPEESVDDGEITEDIAEVL
jgi:hypothetical protein